MAHDSGIRLDNWALVQIHSHEKISETRSGHTSNDQVHLEGLIIGRSLALKVILRRSPSLFFKLQYYIQNLLLIPIL